MTRRAAQIWAEESADTGYPHQPGAPQGAGLPDDTAPPGPRAGARGAGTAALYIMTGVLTHEVIAELAQRTASPTYDDIMLATRAAIARHTPVPMLRSVRLATMSLTSVYFRLLLPAGATLLGAEIALGPDSRCDLTWELPSGAVLIDEIKTGAVTYRANPVCTDQVRRYLADGTERHGLRLRGVRLCHLRAPGLSATFAPGGELLTTRLQS